MKILNSHAVTVERNFSVNAAEELFSEFPEWRKLARTERGDSGAAYLVIEVAAPPESGAM